MTIKTRTRKPKSEYQKKLSWLRQNKTPRHILEVELNYNQNDLRKVLATSNELRIIRNTVLGVVYKNYKQMIRTKRYKNLILSLKNNKDNIKSLNKDSKTYKKDLKNLEQEVKNIYLKLDNLKDEFNVTFDFARKYGEFLRQKKFSKADAVLVWSACEVAFKSLERVMYSDAKKPRFLSKGEYLPLQGKQAERCIILKQDKKTNNWFVSHNKMKFDLKVNYIELKLYL